MVMEEEVRADHSQVIHSVLLEKDLNNHYHLEVFSKYLSASKEAQQLYNVLFDLISF
jgi:hypothetical protein